MDNLIIENNIVKGCTEKNCLTITIPEGVKAIGDDAFKGLTNLYDVVFPSTLTHIGNSAFEGCNALAAVDLSGISYIGECAFMHCTVLKSVIFDDSLPYLCNNTFAGCTSLEKIELPKSITYIGCECFRDCIMLSDLELSGVMEIDNNAFENCSELYSISFPETLLHIAPNAFSFCRNLSTVTVYNRFVDIDETAFENTVKIVIKAVQFSTAYRYAAENQGIIFRPTILNKKYMQITSSQLELLKKNEIMFMMKPSANSPGKADIAFDQSQEEIIRKIIGGKSQ